MPTKDGSPVSNLSSEGTKLGSLNECLVTGTNCAKVIYPIIDKASTTRPPSLTRMGSVNPLMVKNKGAGVITSFGSSTLRKVNRKAPQTLTTGQQNAPMIVTKNREIGFFST